MRGIAIDTLRGLGVTAIPATALELVSVDGTYYPLQPLLLKCQREPIPLRWPDIAYEHFAGIVGSRRWDMVDDALNASLRVQVAPPNTAQHPDLNLLHTRPIASNMDVAVPIAGLQVSDARGAVFAPDTPAGYELDTLWHVACANTAAEPIDQETRLKRDDIVIDVIEGESMFIASKILTMSYVVAGGADVAPYGALVAIPSHHVLAFHCLTSADTALRTGYALADFADHCYRRSSAAVSREVFYWYGGQIQQLSRTDPQGLTDLNVTGMFEQVYREMP
ncbi:hypothetical protein AB0C65_36535 [Nocardia sp. NPDC048505]|uniref:hypothetical protein n=1 Tax=Nocardia sp. NPDC048505 TaxID=3155756 RepID=UPI0033F873DE